MSTPPISPIHVGCSWSVRPDPLTDNQQYAVCQSCIKAYASHSRVNVCKNFSRREEIDVDRQPQSDVDGLLCSAEERSRSELEGEMCFCVLSQLKTEGKTP